MKDGGVLTRLGALGRAAGAIALVHGLGEHSGRYEALAARFVDAGFAVWAIDLRGHGKSPGQRGDTRFARRWRTSTPWWRVRRRAAPGVPVFLYGQLGALLSVLWLLERPAAPVSGAVISAIGLHSALKEQAVKVRMARVLGNVAPKMRVKSGIDPKTLSRDPAVVEAYRRDKLVHNFASLGFGLDALEAIDTIVAGAVDLTVPLLVIHGGDDTLAYASGARARRARPDLSTLRVYDGLYHELHHEPEQEQVFADVLAWLDARLR